MNNSQQATTRFFDNLSVGRRIYLLILVPLAILLITGIFAITALSQTRQASNNFKNQVEAIDTGSNIIRRFQRDYILMLHEVYINNITWADGLKQLTATREHFTNELIPRYKAIKTSGPSEPDEHVKNALQQLDHLVNTLNRGEELLKKEDRNQLELYLQNDIDSDAKTLTDSIQTEAQHDIDISTNTFTQAQQRENSFFTTAIILMLLGTLITASLGYYIYQSIADSVDRLVNTIRQIAEGNMSARAQVAGRNELAELGDMFDRMVDERISTQAKIDRDHKQLNESVFALLEAVSDLSERNLTVRAKVTEDATGPLADAINQLAEDTTDVLKQVRNVATAVEATSQDVNRYAQSVNKLAQLEQTEARETASQLDVILQRLNSIAQSATQANQIADNTSNTTRRAKESVARSVENITSIRNTVQETGKRLKRLGERSQEISQIIDVINNLAERTTVLALNASMQATAAGEAGRGFSMIAEEIQRLAENSRESTNQISTLVHNIQQEANTTIATMDRTIEQVVNGSNLAQDAAQQMQNTLEVTNELVNSVEKIAQSSADQVAISKTIQMHATRILEATQTTGKELNSLTSLTQHMADAGKRLLQSVNVFKLEA